MFLTRGRLQFYLDTYSEVEKFVKQIEEYKSKVESRGKFYL